MREIAVRNLEKVYKVHEKPQGVLGSLKALFHRRYKHVRAVDGISFDIEPGEMVGFLGPNGAGKTTTFYSLVGFIRPDGGSILLDETDVTAEPMYLRARKGLGYLPQEPTVFQGLSVEENLLAVLERTVPSKEERLKTVKDLLGEFHLWKLRSQKAWTLSGGEKRRLDLGLGDSFRLLLTEENAVQAELVLVRARFDLARALTELRLASGTTLEAYGPG